MASLVLHLEAELMATRKIEFEKEKLAELIIFFAAESENDLFFGSTKLNKQLFLADVLSFGHLGKPITGSTYINQKAGPTPKPNQFLPVRESLIEDDRLEIVVEQKSPGKPMKRPIAKDTPKMDLFSTEEQAIIREAIETLRPMTNTQAELWSHEFVGWLYTERGEEVPYGTAFLWQKVPVSKNAREWAKEVATQLGY